MPLTDKKLSYCWQTVKRCPLVNDCNLLAWFSNFCLPLSHLLPSVRGIPSCYRVDIWYEKTRIAGLQSGEGRMMIDSVIWAPYISVTVTDWQTDSHVTIPNAVPMHCIGRQKLQIRLITDYPRTKLRSEYINWTLNIWSLFNICSVCLTSIVLHFCVFY